ncbi:hypothetical protein A2881_03510 [Candidatus Peribacteria bacterium RIFCSPHIGHO2_01_FULL_55_13]|nr:MAG: hypothetical protein A2881_03510 [Candidatus Peribacteria bacterium RIFCSPHIGHO2_01_FULL_55_13]
MQTTISIPGMHCASCATLIKDVSSEFPQIQKADVNVETKIVTIEHAEDFDFAAWKTEIEALGDTYKVLLKP